MSKMSTNELIKIIQQVSVEDADQIIDKLAAKLSQVLTSIEITKLLESNNQDNI